jgi:hypothetical protein
MRALGLPARSLVVFALSFALVEIVESIFRRHAIGGVYFQGLTSETLMQSVSLRELRAAPLESLWYLHVQPPVTNLIRALLLVFHRGASWDEVMRGVDRDLNHVWALTAAALAMLIDAWFRRLRVPGVLAALFTLGWLLHPAAFAYATLLDGTLLSALCTTWVLYETWRFGSSDGGSAGRLSAAVLLAYLTRSLFQWPFVLVMLGSLALLRVPRRQLVIFGAVVGVTVGLYSIKQAYLFGTVSTSTLQGTNLTRSIGADCGPIVPEAAAHGARLTAPVLTEPRKLDGSQNFNHVDRLSIERQLMVCFRRTLARRKAAALWANYRSNLDLFIEPSSTYSRNEIVDRLPWRKGVDWLFSGQRLIWLTIVASLLGIWQSRRRLRSVLALLLPVAYVFGVSVLGERGENIRFKFFLEPALWVLVLTQFHRVVRQAFVLATALARRRWPGAATVPAAGAARPPAPPPPDPAPEAVRAP